MKKFALILLIPLLFGCSNKETRSETWPDNMQELANTLSDLLPYVFNKNLFEDPRQAKTVEKKIKEFEEASHVIPAKRAEEILGKDPLVNMSIDNLKSEISSAREAFEKGNLRYSRHLLQHTLNYCFACHTRSHFGPKYDFFELKSLANADVNPIQKSQIMVATRQFDKAKAILKQNLVAGPQSFDNPYFQEQAIKQYLSIVVRAEEKPEEGYKFVSDFIEKTKLPTYLSRNIESWESSFLNWMAENKKQKKKSLKEAKKLILDADFVNSGFDSDSKYVDYLRASSILHEVLASNLKDKNRAEVLYYLGLVYNLLSESGMWELPEKYFEACVRQLPKSALAKKCFTNFEQNVVVGYSGSAGTFIPFEEKKKLAELKTLAGY